MSLEDVFSHPKSKYFPNGKSLVIHTDGVTEKALLKYKGPGKYKKYLKLISVLHDLGKLNPNFQDYLFGKKVYGFKNHAYLSAVTSLLIILKNPDILNIYDKELIGLSIVLIAKHHGHLIDLAKNTRNLNKEELDRISKFFIDESSIAKKYVQVVNDFIDNYKEFNFVNKLEYEDFGSDFIKSTGLYLEKLMGNIRGDKSLEYFIITQYIFSCLIEGDKRDASDNNNFLQNTELEKFNHEYFDTRLEEYYLNFSLNENSFTTKQKKLNELRSLVKSECVRNVCKYLAKNERVFQIIAPTGSGKTLTFLSVANEIKNFNKHQHLKFIYAIPFLSITDQVTKQCEKIFYDNKDLINRIDSSGSITSEIDEDNKRLMSDFDMKEDIDLSIKDFSEDIFDHAFIVTTFVKFFETLTSNRNKTLLRYNNFSNSIIIIDEIQSLPPRTYTFMVAFISKFAELFNCYILIGSATVPHFDLSNDNTGYFSKTYNGLKIDFRELLKGYKPPINLLENYKEIYSSKIFRRYEIQFDETIKGIDDLTGKILNASQSTLTILNTKKSSLNLYLNIRSNHDQVFLLNTNQTLKDRRIKLEAVMSKLKNNEKVHLISTQLIEAGIDISFPVVYRDLSPFPSIIQSAGRCNRSNEVKLGKTIIMKLQSENGKYYCDYVYRDLMDITENLVRELNSPYLESQLFELQQRFFDAVKDNLSFGEYELIKSNTIDNSKLFSMPEAVKDFQFAKLGQFRLIKSKNPLDEISLFVMQTERDKYEWDEYKNKFQKHLGSNNKYGGLNEIKKLRKNLSDRVISLCLNDFRDHIVLFNIFKEREVFGLSYLSPSEDIGVEYTFEKGLLINKPNLGEFIL